MRNKGWAMLAFILQPRGLDSKNKLRNLMVHFTVEGWSWKIGHTIWDSFKNVCFNFCLLNVVGLNGCGKKNSIFIHFDYYFFNHMDVCACLLGAWTLKHSHTLMYPIMDELFSAVRKGTISTYSLWLKQGREGNARDNSRRLNLPRKKVLREKQAPWVQFEEL